MRLPPTRPPEHQVPRYVGVLYRTTSVREIPSTPAKRAAVLVSLGVLVAVIVLASIA